MTSKRSFWADARTNLRRRIWVIIVDFLVFFFSLPVMSAMSLSSEIKYYDRGNLPQILGRALEELFLLNGFTGFFVILLAIVTAVHGFSYMYTRKKLDMYMSVPVAASRRFAVIYVNGILIFAVSYLVNVAFGLLAGSVMGADISFAFGQLYYTIPGYFILFLAVYNISILAVMLTGHLAVTVMAVGVLTSFDLLCWITGTSYMNSFYKSYFYRTSTELFHNYMILPLGRYSAAVQTIYKSGPIYRSGYSVLTDIYIKHFAELLVVGAVFLILAYRAYVKKPAEACGKALSFKWLRPVVKVPVCVWMGFFGGYLCYSASGENEMFILFGFLAGILLCHSFMEAVYDFDLRSVKKGGRSLAVTMAVAAVLFSIIRLDLTGYDSYVPKASDVQRAVFMFGDEWTMNYYDENMRDPGKENYFIDRMSVDNIEALLELAQRRMGKNYDDMNVPSDVYREYMENGGYMISTAKMTTTTGIIGGADGPTAVFVAGKGWDGEEKKTLPFRNIMVGYELKGGRMVYRQFPTLYYEDLDLLNTLVKDEGYKKTYWNIYNEALLDYAANNTLNISWNAGMGELPLDGVSFDEFRTAYEKDIEDYDMTTAINEYVTGKVAINGFGPTVYVYSSYPVYPGFENTLALIKKCGINDPGYVDAEKIAYLEITNENTEMYEEDENGYVNNDGSYQMKTTIDDPNEILETADALFPYELTEFWGPDERLEYGYDISVVYEDMYRLSSTNDMNARYAYTPGYCFIRDRIPEYVKDRTTYK